MWHHAMMDKLLSWINHLGKQTADIGREQFHRNSEQNNSENLFGNRQAAWTQKTLYGFGQNQNNLNNNDVDQNGENDVHRLKFSTQ
jgi:hypothetical protein